MLFRHSWELHCGEIVQEVPFGLAASQIPFTQT